jgi:hypothetical protein
VVVLKDVGGEWLNVFGDVVEDFWVIEDDECGVVVLTVVDAEWVELWTTVGEWVELWTTVGEWVDDL